MGARLEGILENVWANLIVYILAAAGGVTWALFDKAPAHLVVLTGLLAFVTAVLLVEKVLEALKRWRRPSTAIRQWILDAGDSLAEERGRGTTFNFTVTDRQRNHMNIFQEDNRLDVIVLATAIALPPAERGRISNMPADERDELLWGLRFGLLNMSVGFMPIGSDSKDIRLHTSVYVEGLTRQDFLEKMVLLQRALLFVQFTFARKFKEPAANTP